MKTYVFAALAFMLHSSLMAEKIDFNKQVRPILSDKCFYCHGPDAHDIKGKLQLHSFSSATAARGKKKNKFALA
ncbi:MAG: hypothetical protein HRT88_10800 [Lentisphaeraceae bacterium]|nr:hypothetical protein [Lentisphaeraceae bacterium]